MKVALCNIGFLPVREEPRDSAQMVTCLLFGEAYEILDTPKPGWYRVVCLLDNYPGYVYVTKPAIANDTYLEKYSSQSWPRVTKQFDFISQYTKGLSVGFGSVLPLLDEDTLDGQMPDGKYHYSDILQAIPIIDKALGANQMANLLLGTPYLWGGRSSFGIDCSGLTQLAYQMVGIQLPRDAYQQAEKGEMIPSLEDTQAGDLVFFSNTEGKVNHVGVIKEPGKTMIHASYVVIEQEVTSLWRADGSTNIPTSFKRIVD